jgi:tetratricopeptide (TPR) repeat protein
MEYLGGLPGSVPAVSVPFELGRTAMDAYKWDEAIGHFQGAMRRAVGTERVALHGLIGQCHSRPGRWREALDSFEESARLAEQFRDRQGQACALDNIGVIWRDRGELGRALEKHESALTLAREIGDRREEAAALHDIGGIYFCMDKPDEALACHEDALQIHQETGHRREQAAMLHSIGISWLMKAEIDKALAYLEQAVMMAREVGDKREEAGTLYSIGAIRVRKGELDKALECDEAALTLFRAVGDRGAEAGTLAAVGGRLMERGEYEKAAGLYLAGFEISSALDLAGQTGPGLFRRGLGNCLDFLGRDQFIAACERAGMHRPEAERLAGELQAGSKK